MSDELPMTRLRASAHPVRLRILSLLTGVDLSATDVARELDLTHANASYHLRVLERAGLIVVAGEEKIRGGVTKRYRYDLAESRTAGRGATDPEGQQAYLRATAEELTRRGLELDPAGKIHATDAEVWLRPEVWEQVREHLQEAARIAHEEAQPPRTEGTLHLNLTTVTFEMARRRAPDGEVEG